MNVRIGLDESELSLFTTGKGFPSRSVTIVSDLELASIDSDDGTTVEITHRDGWVRHSLKEIPSVFQIIL